MSWVQPKFTDFAQPIAKKQKTNNHKLKRVKHLEEFPAERNWLNKWKPKKKSELVIHKKKIEEVENWLEETKKKRGSSFLLIFGPPGCGKLSTLKVLCSEHCINLIEWLPQISLNNYNPEIPSDIPYQSEISIFESFVMRATRYSNVLNRNSCRVIIVKDIPIQYSKDNSLFFAFLQKFVNIDDVNLVFITTDFKLTRELFSEDVKKKFNIGTIQFNPVTHRNTLTALQKISKGEFTEYLDSISVASAGDLRNAITTLHFLSVKGILPHKKKQPLTNNTKSESIDLFHTIGRILYPKREENGKLKYCPVTIAESFASSPDLFVNMLHENYLATFSSVHDVARASESLAVSDLLLKPMEKIILSSLSPAISSHALMSYNSNSVKKFQQFNRPVRVQDCLSEFKHIGKNYGSLVDIISYGRLLPSFYKKHTELFAKVKPIGKNYGGDFNVL